MPIAKQQMEDIDKARTILQRFLSDKDFGTFSQRDINNRSHIHTAAISDVRWAILTVQKAREREEGQSRCENVYKTIAFLSDLLRHRTGNTHMWIAHPHAWSVIQFTKRTCETLLNERGKRKAQ